MPFLRVDFTKIVIPPELLRKFLETVFLHLKMNKNCRHEYCYLYGVTMFQLEILYQICLGSKQNRYHQVYQINLQYSNLQTEGSVLPLVK